MRMPIILALFAMSFGFFPAIAETLDKEMAAGIYYLDESERERSEGDACTPSGERTFSVKRSLDIAIREFEEVLKKNPNAPEVLMVLSAAHSSIHSCLNGAGNKMLALQNARIALDYAEQIARIQPNDGVTVRELARLNWAVAQLENDMFEMDRYLVSMGKAEKIGQANLERSDVKSEDYLTLIGIQIDKAIRTNIPEEKARWASDAFCTLQAGFFSRLVSKEDNQKYRGGILFILFDARGEQDPSTLLPSGECKTTIKLQEETTP